MTYSEDRINEKQIVSEITEQIALAMDWELMVDPQPLSDQGIIRKGNKSLYFRLDWRDKSRLNISGGFEGCNQYLPYGGEREKTEITVSRDKPVEKIVKDIQGRLLPGYERMLAHAMERKTREDESKAWQQKELEEIAGLVPGGDIRNGKVYSYESNITCQHWFDGTWELTARLNKDKLKAVLAVINN